MLDDGPVLHVHRDGVRVPVPLARAHGGDDREALAVRLRVHRPLRLHRLRGGDERLERRVRRTEARALHEDVPRALLRGQLPEEDDVERVRVVEREERAVQPCGHVWVRGCGRERGHGAPPAVDEVTGRGCLEGDDARVLRAA